MSYQTTLEIAGHNIIINVDYEFVKFIAGHWVDGAKQDDDEPAHVNVGEVMINVSDGMTPDFKPFPLPDSILDIIEQEILEQYV